MNSKPAVFKLLKLFFIVTITLGISFLVIPSIVFADSYDPLFKKCRANPINANPGQEVLLEVETKSEMKLKGTIVVMNGETKNIPLDETTETKNRTLSLGSFSQPGTYQLQVRYESQLEPMREGCFLNAAFTINDVSSTLKLEAPPSLITVKIKILSSLVISGLTPGTTYQVDLPNWKGADLTHPDPNSHDWTADGSGRISAQNICNDGQANRTDCDEPFGSQVYGVSVKEKGGNNFWYATFEIKYDEEGSSGKNPCEDPVTKQVTECPTALGNIPTDISGFAGKILSIAIGLAGGIALILMVIGSIRVLTSSGDQQRLAGGRDMIVAAIAGLLFLIFSILILRFIGIEILQIPGFG